MKALHKKINVYVSVSLRFFFIGKIVYLYDMVLFIDVIYEIDSMHVNMYLILDLTCVYAIPHVISLENVSTPPANT